MNSPIKKLPHATGPINDYWDHIAEYEVDSSWRREVDSPAYRDYRRRFEAAQQRKHAGPFPISIEIEATYFCNLKCPFCPRAVNSEERDIGHMSEQLWAKILAECKENGLSAMLMDHEAESLMNPRIFDMIREAREAGIVDVWLHTNANQLTAARSEKLIDAGLTKINFSIDATSAEVYDVLRVGGNFKRVLRNVQEFLAIKLTKGAHYLRTRVSFVEQRENMRQRQAFYEFWKDTPGLNIVTYQECTDFTPFEKPDEEVGLSEMELEKKYAANESFHCSMPWEMPIIDTEGNVTPCGVPIRSHNKDFILGNLNSCDTIKSCWNGTKMAALRELHEKGEWYKNHVCRVCVKTVRESRQHTETLHTKIHVDKAE